MGEIVNRVSNSKLKTFDLEEIYPRGERIAFDIKDWLYEALILKEKDFREHVKHHDWSQYKNAFVAVYCSVDAIVPTWAYMLVTTQLMPYAKKVVIGNLELLETSIYQEIIDQMDISAYEDKPLIIKGCADKYIPNSAFGLLVTRLQPHVKSIMFGEACSNVPLFKAKK